LIPDGALQIDDPGHEVSDDEGKLSLVFVVFEEVVKDVV
jgi:hypothetical protein